MSNPATDLDLVPLPSRAPLVVVGGDAAALHLAAEVARAGVEGVVVLLPAEWPAPRRGQWLAADPVATSAFAEAGVETTEVSAACITWDPLAPRCARLASPTLTVDAVASDAAMARRARDLGALLCRGEVAEATWDGGAHQLRLADGGTLEAAVLVDACGLTTRAISGPKAKLAPYRNMTIWVSLEGGQSPATLGGAWNSLAGEAAPIGSGWGCDDGWYWYYPLPSEGVPRHALGLVVDPATVKRTKNRYLDERYFLSLAKQVPHLGQLVSGASCEAETSWCVDQPYVAQRIAEHDEARLRVGLGARFVDPFLWSEASEGLAQAHEAAALVVGRLEGRSDAAAWDAHEARWQQATFGSGLLADQLTHLVTAVEARSVFWKRRARCRFIDLREAGAPLPEPLRFDEASLALLQGVDGALAAGPFAEVRP